MGGAFFLVSDGLIAIDAFSDLDLPAHDVSVMATYVVAQLLLVLGVIRRDASAARDAAPHHPVVVPAQQRTRDVRRRPQPPRHPDLLREVEPGPARDRRQVEPHRAAQVAGDRRPRARPGDRFTACSTRSSV